MTSQLNFRVILSVVAEKTTKEREALACILAATFDVPAKEVLSIFEQLPVVIFDNISGENLKTIKDRLIFLSKMGLDFNITFKPFPELYRTKWQIKTFTPVVFCPSCGEQFILLRADDFHRHVSQKQEQKAPASASSLPSSPLGYGELAQNSLPPGSISAEMEEVDVLSEELDAIMRQEETIDNEIEEVESISQEMKRIGNISSIEGIGGISAEFEEIEGVSAEFEKMCMGTMDAEIGSLSAELEEIEGISAEVASLGSENGIEKIREPLQKIGGVGEFREDSGDYELEELNEMSEGLDKIAEPLDEDLLTNLMDSEVLDSSDRAFKRHEIHHASNKAPIKAEATNAPQNKNPGDRLQPIKFPPGNYHVMINFSGRGNIKGGNQLLGTIKGAPVEEIEKLTERHAAIIVANNIALDAAKRIVEQFQKLKLQGRIVPNRKK